jgi:hypothetical protein
VLAAFLREVYKNRTDETFPDKSGKLRPRFDNRGMRLKFNDRGMLKMVERLVAQDSDLQWNPVLDKIVGNLKKTLANTTSPIDLLMQDMRGPLLAAIKKGASRDDLVRMVDEAIAEDVMLK